ncbi:DUF4839 domain-containing protein [Agrococcus sp. HG114]|uniref:DUF4839 domain-containing protein n=1 Tax=Agrococcus sp. HG114 TaxID=2969757 RepID=UPI00215A4427|nr:DUF4839 domain-containing protein [Agrococcus sp. HG114]MCR8669769.1 DUF4839 domain-containing protein [Agrococcus sp. HG114]
MSDNGQFQTSTTTVVRGFESRTIAKWEADGWELVGQSQGALRSELTFRRPKPKVPMRQIAIGLAAAVVLAAAVGVGSALGSDDDAPATSESAAAPADTQVPAAESEPAVTEPATTSGAAASSENAEPTPLTIENSEDLAALLTGPDQGPTVEQFAAEYEGRLIEFDASIGAMALHSSYSTRYDILLTYGDYSETISHGGPSFQFRDVDSDDVPDSIGVGDNVRITARVLEFDNFRLLFQLEPVATQIR